MLITREDVIKRISVKTGYCQKDIREVLHGFDDTMFEALCEIVNEEEVSVQLLKGLKIHCVSVPERARKNPRDRSDVICPATCRVKTKVSRDLQEKLQEYYSKKKDG